jgi:hypothetical protein
MVFGDFAAFGRQNHRLQEKPTSISCAKQVEPTKIKGRFPLILYFG